MEQSMRYHMNNQGGSKKKPIHLDQDTVDEIEEILNSGGKAEIAVFRDKLVVFENRSKKRYEMTVTVR